MTEGRERHRGCCEVPEQAWDLGSLPKERKL